jgi:hypothetical protein
MQAWLKNNYWKGFIKIEELGGSLKYDWNRKSSQSEVYAILANEI